MPRLAVSEKHDKSFAVPEKYKDPYTTVKICFVCTGNTCRSPMAAAVLNAFGKGRYQAFSAGIAVNEGEPIAANAVRALEEAGIVSTDTNDYSKHVSRQLTDSICDECDLLVGVSENHAMMLIYGYPGHAHKVAALSENIPDPYMYGQDVYRLCLEKIIASVKETFEV